MNIKRTAAYAARSAIGTNPWTRGRIRRLHQNERLSASDLEQLQTRYLYETLQVALRRFPFYEGVSTNFTSEDARRVLRELPVIDKTTLLDNPTKLYPHGGKPRPWELSGKTSGTTGTPLVVYRSVESAAMEQVFIRRHWEWAGYSRGSTRVTLRGDMVVPLEQQKPPFWYWNKAERQLVVSSRHLQEPFIASIIEAIRETAPDALQAYPSTAYTLARLLRDRDETLRIPYVFSASEPLYGHQRELIGERMGSTIMDMYGMAERVAFATGCEHGSMHLNSDYSFLEVLDEDGEPTSGEGFVVGTTFHNRLMPLVRYRLSDRTRLRDDNCPCGRTFPVIEPVTGKYEDTIFGAAGNPISPSVLTFAFKGVHNIAKSQVAQVARGRWELRLVPLPEFSEADGAKLLSNIHHLVDSRVTVDLVMKQDLPNTKAGKFRWVVNETSEASQPS